MVWGKGFIQHPYWVFIELTKETYFTCAIVIKPCHHYLLHFIIITANLGLYGNSGPIWQQLHSRSGFLVCLGGWEGKYPLFHSWEILCNVTVSLFPGSKTPACFLPTSL